MELSETELQAFREFEQSGWNRAADSYHRHWGSLSQQSAEPMLDAARVKADLRVLDVATGAGYVAAAAARRGARVTGIDFSEAQVGLARFTYPLVEFRRGDAEVLPFDAGSVDAVVIGFGVNHLPHPERAFSEAFRVLRRGGSFAYTVWAAPKPGEGFGIVLGAIERHGVTLPPAPPYFRFADPGEARQAFERAGFVEPDTRVVDQFWHHERPSEVFDAFNFEGAVRATAMLQGQPQASREKIRAAVCREVELLYRDGKYVVPVPAALSWGRKP